MMGKPLSGTIRTARGAEVAQLAAIERAAGQLFPAARIPQPEQTYPLAALEQAAAEGMLFVAEENDEPVGFAVCSLSGDRIHLDEVSVHPDHGRKGYGRALVSRVIELARQKGVAGVSLTTFADIPWNGPFYASMGFTRLPESLLDSALREALAHEQAMGMTERIAMFYRLTPLGRLSAREECD